MIYMEKNTMENPTETTEKVCHQCGDTCSCGCTDEITPWIGRTTCCGCIEGLVPEEDWPEEWEADHYPENPRDDWEY